MRIKEKLQHIIKDSLIKLNVEKKLNEIIIENSKENEFIYYSNIAISLSKDLHKKPEEIADNLKNIIKDELIEKIEVQYPGTLYIYLNKKILLNIIPEIIEKNINYGKSNIGEKRKINIDFINTDICDYLDNNSIFNAIYADNISRILKYNDFNIVKEYYVNDNSKKLIELSEKTKERYEEICKNNSLNYEKQDNNLCLRDTAYDIYNLYKDSKLEEKLEYFKKEEISTLLYNQQHLLDKYRINYDTSTKEQSLYDKGLVDKILDILNRKGYTYLFEDELWLKTTSFNDKKDRILIKSDGAYTKILPLIAYQEDRLNRKYDGLINIYNINNHEDKKYIKPILKMLEEDLNKVQINILPQIKITKNNNEIENINTLLEDYEVNSIRYLFASQKVNNEIEIDLDTISKQVKENPIYYIEKINIILHQTLKGYTKKITKINKFSTINNDIAYIILNKLNEFEDVVITSGLKQMPHLICDYLLELSKLFNTYYKEEKIITEDEIYTNERLNMLLAIKIVINNALDLIGIIPRED